MSEAAKEKREPLGILLTEMNWPKVIYPARLEMDERTVQLMVMADKAVKEAECHIRMQRHQETEKECARRLKAMEEEKKALDERIEQRLIALMAVDGARSAALKRLIEDITSERKKAQEAIDREMAEGYQYPRHMDGKVAG